MNDRDIDAEFDAIVAHWDDADDSTPPPPRTVQDITAAYAALSRPEPDSPPPDEPGADTGTPAEPRVEPDAGRDAQASTAPEDHRHLTEGPAPLSETAPARDSAAPPPAGPRAPAAAGAPAEPEAWRQGASTDDEDDHFEPPPVQLPPGEDIGYWGALLGLVGGPLVLLWVVLTKPFYAGWWTLGAILLFFGGFALLVLRQPKDRDPFDDDNGARV